MRNDTENPEESSNKTAASRKVGIEEPSEESTTLLDILKETEMGYLRCEAEAGVFRPVEHVDVVFGKDTLVMVRTDVPNTFAVDGLEMGWAPIGLCGGHLAEAVKEGFLRLWVGVEVGIFERSTDEVRGEGGAVGNWHDGAIQNMVRVGLCS